MGEIRIYKLNLDAGDFSVPTVNWSTAWGGTDPPITGYPEFGQLENIHRIENAGVSGQHVADAVDTLTYAVAWINMCGVGTLANGQFDCRGGGAGKPLKCRWQQYLKASAITEGDFCNPLVLANGSAGGTGSGLLSTQRFFSLEMWAFGGASGGPPPAFKWVGSYAKPDAGGLGFTMTNVLGSDDVADNAEHQIIVTIVPSTVTGAFNGSGGMGSATIAADGSFSVAVGDADGSSMETVVSAAGLEFIINPYATTNPAVYYGKTIWHGD